MAATPSPQNENDKNFPEPSDPGLQEQGSTSGAGSSTGGGEVPAAPGSTAPPMMFTRSAGGLWLRALAAVGIGYGAMLVCAVIAIGLALMGVAFSAAGESSGELSPDAVRSELDSTFLPGVEQHAPGPFQMLLSLPFQLVGLALFGKLRLWGRYAYDGETMEGHWASLGLSNVLVLAAGVVAMWLWWRWSARRAAAKVGQPTLPVWQKFVVAVTVALVAAGVVTFLTWATSVRWSMNTDYDEFLKVSIGAASPTLFFGAAFVLALTLALLMAGEDLRGRITPRVAGWAPSLSRAVRVLGLHFLLVCVPVALGLVIAAFVKFGAAAGLSALLWLPWGLLQTFGLANLTGLTTRTTSAWSSDVTASGETRYLWGMDLPWWVVLLVLVVSAIALVAAATSWLLRRDVAERTLKDWRSWLVIPVAYLVLGLVLQVMSRGRADMTFDPEGGESMWGSAGLAPWTFLVFLLVGALVEVLARYLAPAIAAALPRSVISMLRGSAPRAAAPAAVPAEATSPDGASSAGAAGAVGGAALRDTEPDGHSPVTATQPQAFVPGEATAGRTPEQNRKAKRILILGLAAGVLVVGAVIAFQIVSRTAFGPDQPVKDTLDALRDGEAGTVMENADPNVTGNERLLLTDDIYAVSGNPVTNYRVTSVERSGDTATVTADIVQDSVTTPVSFAMERDGRKFGLFPTWRMSEVPEELYGDVEVSFPETESITVNGVETEVPQDLRGETATLAALPGDYSFDPEETSKYLSFGEEQTVQVVLDESAGTTGTQVSFTAEPTDALEKDAETAINAKLDDCAAVAEFDPEGCPLSASWLTSYSSEDYRDPKWTIDEYPTYSVDTDYEGSIRFNSDDSGQATLDYEHNEKTDDDDPDDWEPQDYDGSFSVYGSIEVKGDELEVSLDD